MYCIMHGDLKQGKWRWWIFEGNSLAVKWLSDCIAKEKTIVEDALARNQERKTDSVLNFTNF